jgi:hypothetical protein
MDPGLSQPGDLTRDACGFGHAVTQSCFRSPSALQPPLHTTCPKPRHLHVAGLLPAFLCAQIIEQTQSPQRFALFVPSPIPPHTPPHTHTQTHTHTHTHHPNPTLVTPQDVTKYAVYQEAVRRALLDRVPQEEAATKVTTLMVVGAGEGRGAGHALRSPGRVERLLVPTSCSPVIRAWCAARTACCAPLLVSLPLSHPRGGARHASVLQLGPTHVTYTRCAHRSASTHVAQAAVPWCARRSARRRRRGACCACMLSRRTRPLLSTSRPWWRRRAGPTRCERG